MFSSDKRYGQTDRQICYINIRVSMMTRDKNGVIVMVILLKALSLSKR